MCVNLVGPGPQTSINDHFHCLYYIYLCCKAQRKYFGYTGSRDWVGGEVKCGVPSPPFTYSTPQARLWIKHMQGKHFYWFKKKKIN